MNILIVEDDLLIAEMLKTMLTKMGHNILKITSTYQDTFKFLKDNPPVDLIFLDINLEALKNGIDIGKELSKNHTIPFIYLTSYADPKTIKTASATLPEAYLTKPFNEVMLLSTLEIIQQKKEVKNKRINIKTTNKIVPVLINEIYFFKSEGNYVKIHLKDQRLVTRASLNQLYTEINCKEFIQIHRSFIINVKFVEEVYHDSLKINNQIIPISRKYKNAIYSLFER